jgi:hypothetical protein
MKLGGMSPFGGSAGNDLLLTLGVDRTIWQTNRLYARARNNAVDNAVTNQPFGGRIRGITCLRLQVS